MGDDFVVSESFVDEAVSRSSKALVGMVMKRFELCDNKETIKKEVKELIYENYRELKENLKSFNCGVRFYTRPKQ